MFFNRNKSNGSYSQVTVNGKTIRVRGNNITIMDDEIIVDGKVLNESMDFKNITVIVEGNCNKLAARGSVEIKGDCGSVDCGGSCHIAGDSGSVDCGGSCHIEGIVKGSVDAGGSVTCGDVDGDIDAGGSVRRTRRKDNYIE